MDEQIVAAVIRRDEAEPLVRVEPFHCAFCHVYFSLDPFGPIDWVPSGTVQGVNSEGENKRILLTERRLPHNCPSVYKINPKKRK
jgi:hypothetical protein